MPIRATPLAHLIEDASVYPRHAVDDTHVGTLVQAIRAGAALPPIVAEAKTGRLVDGWHRTRAYRRVLGAEGVTDVDHRAYKSEADLLLDAIRLNATHGRRLDRVDQVRIVLLAEEAKVPLERLAASMNVTVDRITTLRVRVAIAPLATSSASGDGTVSGETIQVPLKRPMVHFAGKEMTRDQMVAHGSMAGTSFLLQAHQVRDALRFDLMNREDDRLMDALRELKVELDRYLATLPRTEPAAV